MSGPTTANCIAWLDNHIKHNLNADILLSIRAKLLAADDDKNDVIRIHKEKIDLLDDYIKLKTVADEMAKALELAKKTIDLIVKYPNLANNLSRSQQREDQSAIEKALTTYRKAGGK